MGAHAEILSVFCASQGLGCRFHIVSNAEETIMFWLPKCNSLLIMTWQLSCHTFIWAAPVTDSNTLNLILFSLFVFFPHFSLSFFCRSLFFSSGQAGERSDRCFSPTNYSFCSDSASHTLWLVFTRCLQGIMEVLVSTVCVCAYNKKMSMRMTGIVMMNVEKVLWKVPHDSLKGYIMLLSQWVHCYMWHEWLHNSSMFGLQWNPV